MSNRFSDKMKEIAEKHPCMSLSQYLSGVIERAADISGLLPPDGFCGIQFIAGEYQVVICRIIYERSEVLEKAILEILDEEERKSERTEVDLRRGC